MKLSIVIPTYEMEGKGVEYLERSLKMLNKQTFKDFEIVISDNSKDEAIWWLCSKYKVNYFKNPRLGMASNTNYAINRAKGDFIKILYQDDYLADENALQRIVDALKAYPKTTWLITACDTNPYPRWTEDIHRGNNKLGSPSVLTIRKDVDIRFDENLKWLLDCDFYKRMHYRFGEPVILDDIGVIMGIGEHQQTSTLSDELKDNEYDYMHQKYA